MKLLELHNNTWNYLTELKQILMKLLALHNNTWNYLTVFKQIINC